MMKAVYLALLACLMAAPALADERPNIVLILVDDMGFSDLGCYGGEIHTPNLDRLAADGLRFTQFYNCAKCETTRATLMSGRYHPEVGVRRLTGCVTIAEALRPAGYTTLMTGKWHLTSTPRQRGFDRYFGHLSGACNFFTFYGTHNALRAGDWKLVNKDRGSWELYNLAADRTELHDLSTSQPERLAQMKQRWEELSSKIGGTRPRGAKRKKTREPK